MPAQDRLALAVATWFGAGRAPRAPGTVGTLASLPLHGALLLSPLGVHVAVALLLSGAGIWAAERAAAVTGQKDPQSVVIDEVAGVGLALLLTRGLGLVELGLAVALFRVLDIAKPGPIRRLERLNPPGLGIMADDLLAGVLAGAVVRAASGWLAA
ncbi:MAG: phosphatidylglycerophosphatase A [Deltaproteobacteria bacterium]|nr:phosphatidylglycerophosphatase A [Deltaproteobacteria bacterium]